MIVEGLMKMLSTKTALYTLHIYLVMRASIIEALLSSHSRLFGSHLKAGD